MHLLIVDEHTMIRRGIRSIVHERHPDALVTDHSALADAEKELQSTRFDVVVLELIAGDVNGFAALERWSNQYPHTSFLVYSMAPEHLYADRALALGAAGFVSKKGPESELMDALDQVQKGGTYLSSSLQHMRLERGSNAVNNPFKALSDREFSVMHELLTGEGIKEISLRMAIRPSTVATYKARLLEKLGITTVTELRRLADIHGVISP
jgi:DNA-binding NarL/FixJ family response regulator